MSGVYLSFCLSKQRAAQAAFERVQDDLEFLIFLLHLLLALQADVMVSDSQEKNSFLNAISLTAMS